MTNRESPWVLAKQINPQGDAKGRTSSTEIKEFF